mmetsp:Transcript_26990/g.74453  ORF Transcript_26990/g.74453 Transcript_26990/m.74453 type:complete len:275 (+) Transcript_26990:177-1001(+)
MAMKQGNGSRRSFLQRRRIFLLVDVTYAADRSGRISNTRHHQAIGVGTLATLGVSNGRRECFHGHIFFRSNARAGGRNGSRWQFRARVCFFFVFLFFLRRRIVSLARFFLGQSVNLFECGSAAQFGLGVQNKFIGFLPRASVFLDQCLLRRSHFGCIVGTRIDHGGWQIVDRGLEWTTRRFHRRGRWWQWLLLRRVHGHIGGSSSPSRPGCGFSSAIQRSSMRHFVDGDRLLLSAAASQTKDTAHRFQGGSYRCRISLVVWLIRHGGDDDDDWR